MSKLLDKIKSKYKEPLDERIIEFLDNVVSDLDSSQTTKYSTIILDMLVPQLIMYFKAVDILQQNAGVSNKDIYDRSSKSPEIMVLNKAHDQILNLLDKLAMSPMEKAKIKRINKNEEESAKELLDSLMS